MKCGATAAYTYAFKGTEMKLSDYLDSLATLPTLGINCFDLEILQDQHISIYTNPDNIKALKHACSVNKIEIVGFTAWACVKYLHSQDQAMHERGYELFKRICAIASDFKCDYVHLGSDMISDFVVERDHTYASAPPLRIVIPNELSYLAVLDAYALRLRKMAQIAAEHSLKFQIEPRANALIAGADSFLDIYRRTEHKNLYCCLDVIHCCFHREDIPIAIEKLGDRLLGLQFCDSISGDLTHYPIGEGKADLPTVLHSLQKNNFLGYLMLEIYHGGKDAKKLVDSQYASAMQMIKTGLKK